MSEVQRVTVTNIDISFLHMVWLLVKFAFAVIPALIIISVIMTILLTIIGGIPTLAT